MFTSHDYQYSDFSRYLTERPIEKRMPQGAIPKGQGRTSAYLAVLLAGMGLLTVLAFKFPTYLTTAELRDVYGTGIAMIRLALHGALIGGASLALFSVFRGKAYVPAFMALTILAVAQLLGGADVTMGEVASIPLSVGVDWLVISIIAVGFSFAALEKLNPVKSGQPLLRDKWVLDMKYFVINHLALGFFVIVTNNAMNYGLAWAQVDTTTALINRIHPLAQFGLIMILIDVMQYWGHRMFHTVPFLWRFHAVHHSTKRMDWLASSRMHILEPLFMRIVMLAPIFVLGFDQAVVNTYAVFVSFQAILLHANLKLNLGWFEKIFVVVRHHHWHHANEDRAINTNYAVHFPILDKMFGTMCAAKGWPEAYGVQEELPDSVIGQAAYPFGSTK